MSLETLSVGTTTCLSWRDDKHLFDFFSLNTDLGHVITQNISLCIRRSMKDLIDLTYSDKVSSPTSSFTTVSI